MRIACLAWGSLVWDPRTLPVGGVFREDGPRLPIEFSRVSLDGRVTLVIDPEAPRLQTLWVPLAVDSLEQAVTELGRRERIDPDRRADWVGRGAAASWSPATGTEAEIAGWLEARGLDAVVWTALPARLPDGREGRPTTRTLLDHLEGLRGEARTRAEEYVRRTPPGVRPPRRAHFESALGWHPSDG